VRDISSTYEFAVRQAAKGKWLAARILLIVTYITLPLTMVVIGLNTGTLLPCLVLSPVAVWLLYFFTWRYVCVEYEYAITGGDFTLSRVFGGRSRRRMLTITLKDAVRIAPLENEAESEKATAWHPEREYIAVSSFEAPDIYFILFELDAERNKDKRRAILYLEATQKALHIFKYYNASATVVQQVTR